KKKYDRLVQFGGRIALLRETIARHLSRQGLPRERVLACILKILALSYLRPGSEVYANEHGSYGITTLRSKHVRVRGDRIILDFVGKSGVRQHRELVNRSLAHIITELLRLPGTRVFQFQNDDGTLARVTPRHINVYIKEVMGDRFT